MHVRCVVNSCQWCRGTLTADGRGRDRQADRQHHAALAAAPAAGRQSRGCATDCRAGHGLLRSQIVEQVTGFFDVLAEWKQASTAAANDHRAASSTTLKSSEAKSSAGPKGQGERPKTMTLEELKAKIQRLDRLIDHARRICDDPDHCNETAAVVAQWVNKRAQAESELEWLFAHLTTEERMFLRDDINRKIEEQHKRSIAKPSEQEDAEKQIQSQCDHGWLWASLDLIRRVTKLINKDLNRHLTSRGVQLRLAKATSFWNPSGTPNRGAACRRSSPISL